LRWCDSALNDTPRRSANGAHGAWWLEVGRNLDFPRSWFDTAKRFDSGLSSEADGHGKAVRSSETNMRSRERSASH
jgi:hypothetical protein